MIKYILSNIMGYIYPPHISLACNCIKLNVDKVEKFNHENIMYKI